MNKFDNKLNSVLLVIVLGVILCLIKDFISIRSYDGMVGVTNEKFYNGIILDGYNCAQFSVIQVKFKWDDFDCFGYNPNRTVISIKDTSKGTNNYTCEGGKYEFYRDERYMYYFECDKVDFVIVNYDNNYFESVESALKNKRIVLGDLDNYGIEYKKEKIK